MSLAKPSPRHYIDALERGDYGDGATLHHIRASKLIGFMISRKGLESGHSFANAFLSIEYIFVDPKYRLNGAATRAVRGALDDLMNSVNQFSRPVPITIHLPAGGRGPVERNIISGLRAECASRLFHGRFGTYRKVSLA